MSPERPYWLDLKCLRLKTFVEVNIIVKTCMVENGKTGGLAKELIVFNVSIFVESISLFSIATQLLVTDEAIKCFNQSSCFYEHFYAPTKKIRG